MVHSREKDDVDDIEKGVETNHDGNRRYDARGGGGADASRAPFDGKPAVTSDRADEQSEHEALQNAGNDVAYEQGVQHKVLEINKRDIEIGARDKRSRKDRRDARDD